MRVLFKIFILCLVLPVVLFSGAFSDHALEAKVDSVLSKMTLSEKIGQMCQIMLGPEGISQQIQERIRHTGIGSFINVEDFKTRQALQKMAVDESPHGIPLLFGRDVIHGYRTVFPIPLGQSSSWNPLLIEKAARIAAIEASFDGIHWTFAPMLDITHDPRWGRIAETLGEDPFLASVLGSAMVRGFQGKDFSSPNAILACAKHYVGYGAAEGGRDYNTTWIPEIQLRETFLPSFRSAVETGVATIMSAFNDLNGIPASGNAFILRQILKKEWQFQGFVVSDWEAVQEMIAHTYCKDTREAAQRAIEAGVDMEMVSHCYSHHLETLVKEGIVPISLVDDAVRRILRVKFQKGLFEHPFPEAQNPSKMLHPDHLALTKELAIQSLVLLKNENGILPLSKAIRKVGIVGPLADHPLAQLGCWAPDGKKEEAITPLSAIRFLLGEDRVVYVPGLRSPRDTEISDIPKLQRAMDATEVILAFVGEDHEMSGEAASRASLDLPGKQEDLILALAQVRKPIVMIVMAGRPLTFGKLIPKVHAILYAWHPGTMGGPAIADILFGQSNPSGKLTVSFPRSVGQIPIYYNHKSTGRPPKPFPPKTAFISPLHFDSKYIDLDFTAQFPFGYGLSYTEFQYSDLKLSSPSICMTDTLKIQAKITNVGKRSGEEIVQLYIQDLVGSVTRPVKELKGFQRIFLQPGESKEVYFSLTAKDLAFWNKDMQFRAEPGQFHVWVGPNSVQGLQEEFILIP